MSKNIVVGVTAGAASARALDWAAERAARRRQGLELVSVVGGAIGTVGEDDVLAAALRAARAHLEAEAARVSEAHPGLAVTTRTDAGNPVTVLIDASSHADLLVIGSDHTGAGRRGAHGFRIAAGAHCPVVVVPDIDLGERRGVVVGLDGSELSEHALRFAAAEADRMGEPLVAVSVWTPVPMTVGMAEGGVYPDLYLTNMQAATEEIQALALAGIASDHPDLEVIRRVEQGYPSQVIDDAAASARLVVVGTRGRGAFARFLLGSVSHEVLSRVAAVTAVVR